MASFKLFCFLLFVLSFQQLAQAQTDLTFVCKGRVEIDGVYTEHETIDIKVKTSTGEFYGFRNVVAMGCADLSVEEPAKTTSKSTESSFEMFCSNKYWSSKLMLSRYTSILQIATIRHDSVVTTRTYNCEQQKNRKF